MVLALRISDHYRFSLLDFHWKLKQDYYICLFMLEFFIYMEYTRAGISWRLL
jgi:hypothetical protein